MSFTGNAINLKGIRGSNVPANADDLSDIVSIVSPYETPLLDALGDPYGSAGGTTHTWFDGMNDRTNQTQIFTSHIRVTKDRLEARKLSLCDELDYQKQEHLRQLIRDLEHCVVCGHGNASPVENPFMRRMTGITNLLRTNVFVPGRDCFPDNMVLSRVQLDLAMRAICAEKGGRVDAASHVIAVNGDQRRRINGIITEAQPFDAFSDRSFRDLVSVYEGDYGTCRIVLSRSVPADSVLFLASEAACVNVMPLAYRHFYHVPKVSTDDYEEGEITGEYTVEVRDEASCAMISGLTKGV
jgi:hypothetical protein